MQLGRKQCAGGWRHHCDSPVGSPKNWKHWYWRQGEVEEEGEEGERDRWVDSGSPLGELGGAGHLPLEVERGTREGEHQRQWEWWSIQGEGLANHHPVEAEGVGSLTKTRRDDWLKAFTKITSKYYHFNLTQNRTTKHQNCLEYLATLRSAGWLLHWCLVGILLCTFMH